MSTGNQSGESKASRPIRRRKEDDSRGSEEGARWPEPPWALLVMGKRQGTKRLNLQLRARVARAAALWRDAPAPKPLVLFVAADVGRSGQRDAEWVSRALVDPGGVAAEHVVTRPLSHCTFTEVRAARKLAAAHDVRHILAVTHRYHAPRACRYLREVLPASDVVAVAESEPRGLDAVREGVIEWILGGIHSTDPEGRIERALAARLRS